MPCHPAAPALFHDQASSSRAATQRDAPLMVTFPWLHFWIQHLAVALNILTIHYLHYPHLQAKLVTRNDVAPRIQDDLATVTRRASFSMERGSDYGDYGNSEELHAANAKTGCLCHLCLQNRLPAAWPGPNYRWHSSHPAGLSKEGTHSGQERYGSTEYHDNTVHLSSKFSHSSCFIFFSFQVNSLEQEIKKMEFHGWKFQMSESFPVLLLFPLTSTN